MKVLKVALLIPFIVIFVFEAYMVLAFVLGFHRSEEHLRLLPNNIVWLLFCVLITLFFVIKKMKSSFRAKEKL